MKSLLAPVLLAAFAAPALAADLPPAKVRIAVAQMRDIAPVMEVPGTVYSKRDAKVAAQVDGRLVWVAEVGTRLAAGAEIARIDDRGWKLERDALDAQIRSLEVQSAYQTREAQRMEKLAANANIPAARLDEAMSNRDTAAQDLAQARAQRDRMSLNIERAVVRAPFAGQVAQRLMELGEYPTAGTPVARLVAVDDLEIRAQAPLHLASILKEGAEVQLGDQHARLTRMILVGESNSRTFEIRIDPPSGVWVVGAAVKVGIASAPAHAALAVSRDALVLRNSGTAVFRVGADGKAERVAVEAGTALGDWVEVKGGVKPGDRVIIRGAERLSEGQALDIESRADAGTPSAIYN